MEGVVVFVLPAAFRARVFNDFAARCATAHYTAVSASLARPFIICHVTSSFGLAMFHSMTVAFL